MEETPAQDPTPDECVDREWALHLLELACERLRKEAEEARLTGVYDQFRAQLEDPAHAPSHAETASRLGKSTGAISVGVHRMRARFAWLVHDEIRQTVADPTRWREERDHLMAILRDHPLQ